MTKTLVATPDPDQPKRRPRKASPSTRATAPQPDVDPTVTEPELRTAGWRGKGDRHTVVSGPADTLDAYAPEARRPTDDPEPANVTPMPEPDAETIGRAVLDLHHKLDELAAEADQLATEREDLDRRSLALVEHATAIVATLERLTAPVDIAAKLHQAGLRTMIGRDRTATAMREVTGS